MVETYPHSYKFRRNLLIALAVTQFLFAVVSLWSQHKARVYRDQTKAWVDKTGRELDDLQEQVSDAKTTCAALLGSTHGTAYK